jgi:hypothetical protein
VYRLTQLVAECSSAIEAGATSEADHAKLRRAVEERADVLSRLEKLVAFLPEES